MKTNERKVGLLILSLFLAVAIVGCPAPIDEPAITVPGDYPTIQAAIEAAEDGDVIVVEPRTYWENVDFMGKAITLRSTAADDPEVVAATIIHGGNDGSVGIFRTGETGEAVLTDFTITGGTGTWKVFQVGIEGRKKEVEGYFGGGILIAEGSSPTINNNRIIDNTAEFGGGIAVIYNSSPTITGNVITGNTADEGGGIAVRYNSSATVTGNLITDNTAKWRGGAIGVSGCSVLHLNVPDDNVYHDNVPDDIYYE